MKLVTPRANVGARIDLPPIRAPHSQPIDEHALRLPVDGNERVGSQRGGIPRVELHRAKVEVSLPREWQMAVAQYAATQIKTHFSYDRPNGVASGTLHKLNDVLSYKILNGFADNLDPGREFLTQEVIDGWQQRFGDKFDDVLKSGDLRIVFALYNDYRQIVAGRLNWCLEQLQKPFDLEAEDTLRIPKNDTWSRDTASLDVQWLKRMKLRVIDDVLSGKDVAESHKKFAAELADVELRPSFSRDEERVSEWGFDAFMNGYFGSLDRFSRYVPPSEMNRMEARSRGSFSGIGCTISIKYEPDASGVYKRQVKLGSVTEGGPAERAGVRAGDRLISIRDHATDELTVLEGRDTTFASDHIIGETGTSMTLTVEREGQKLSFEIEREEIRTETGSVLSTRLQVPDADGKPRDVGVIRLPGFYSDCADDVIDAVSKLTEEGAEAVVLDLRANGGGSKRDSDRIVAAFTERGSPVNVSVTPADAEPEEVVWDKDDIHFKTPLVIMVDGGSASASELVSGALQAHNRALIFGLPTYGKGSIQGFTPYTFQTENGDIHNFGGAWITGGKFFDPSGRSPHCRGVIPDVGVLDAPSAGSGRQGCEVPQVRLQLQFETPDRGLDVEKARETFAARREADADLDKLAGEFARGHVGAQEDIALSLEGRRKQLKALEEARGEAPESARRYNGMNPDEYAEAVAEDAWLREAAVALFSATPRE